MCITSLTWKQDMEGSLFSCDTSNDTYLHSRSCTMPYRAPRPFCEHEDLLLIDIMAFSLFEEDSRYLSQITLLTQHGHGILTVFQSTCCWAQIRHQMCPVAELEARGSTMVIRMNSSSQPLSIFRNINSTFKQGRKSSFIAFEPWTVGVNPYFTRDARNTSQ